MTGQVSKRELVRACPRRYMSAPPQKQMQSASRSSRLHQPTSHSTSVGVTLPDLTTLPPNSALPPLGVKWQPERPRSSQTCAVCPVQPFLQVARLPRDAQPPS